SPSRRSAAVPLRLPAGALSQGACPPLLGDGRAQGTVTGRLSGDGGTLPALGRRRPPRTRPVTLLCGPGSRRPVRGRLCRRLPGPGRDSAAPPGQGLFECLGLQGGSFVLRPCHAAPALFGHTGAGAATVLTDVLVACAPDAGFELDGRVLVK